jgi:S-DNA-T family DNA segregation ATPase FtsK/SpoIIIE
MARSQSIPLRKTSRFLNFLPGKWQEFLQNRFREAGAGIASLGGAFLTVALATHSASDPSLNTASNAGDIANWMGLLGAYTSDLLLQSFGIGASCFALAFLVWGWRLWQQDDFSPFWLRFVSILAAALFFSIAGGAVPAGETMTHATFGGAGGVLLLNMMTGWIDGIIPFAPHIVVALICACAAAFLTVFGIALRRAEREAMVESFLSSGSATIGGAARIWAWLRPGKSREEYDFAEDADNDDSEDYESDDETNEDEEESAPSGRKRALKSMSSAIQVVRPNKSDAPSKTKKKKDHEQARLDLREPSEWELPGLDLLQEVPDQTSSGQLDESGLRKNAELLQNVLRDYNVHGEITSIHPGPVVTLYELEPAAGTKTSRVVGLADDIARSMSAISVRVAVVPGRNVIGIELPNKKRQTVFLRDLLEGHDFEKTGAKLPLVLGKDIGGQPIIADLSRMPHLLVAGTTGSGKSVAVNTMILSLLYRLPPEKCRFIMIDPKMLELSVYDDIPHLLSPVVTEAGRAVVALKWTVQEMENRYRNMSKLGVRNIEGYNQRLKEARKKGEVLMRKVQTGFDPETGKPVYEEQPLDLTELPYIVVVVDEFADLMLVAGKDVENAIQRLAQMARAAGIHLIMATQRPSVDVITGVIKANFPTRISFQVTSKIDSRTILGEGGAETLLGMGDMLYMAAGGRITRVHGPFVSDREVEDVVGFLKAQGEPNYLEEVTEGDLFGDGDENGEDGDGSGVDELYDEAVAIVAREGKASTSFIQRHLQIGYNRAARIIEEMERQGVVTPANRVGKREVLVGNH